MNRADTVHDKAFSRKAMSDSSPPLGKGRQSVGCSPTAQAYPLREGGYPSAEKPFAPTVPPCCRVLLILFRASIILCSVAFIISAFHRLSTFLPPSGAFLSLLCGLSVPTERFSVQAVGRKRIKKRPAADRDCMNMQKAGEDPEILPRAVPPRFQPSSG